MARTRTQQASGSEGDPSAIAATGGARDRPSVPAAAVKRSAGNSQPSERQQGAAAAVAAAGRSSPARKRTRSHAAAAPPAEEPEQQPVAGVRSPGRRKAAADTAGLSSPSKPQAVASPPPAKKPRGRPRKEKTEQAQEEDEEQAVARAAKAKEKEEADGEEGEAEKAEADDGGGDDEDGVIEINSSEADEGQDEDFDSEEVQEEGSEEERSEAEDEASEEEEAGPAEGEGAEGEEAGHGGGGGRRQASTVEAGPPAPKRRGRPPGSLNKKEGVQPASPGRGAGERRRRRNASLSPTKAAQTKAAAGKKSSVESLEAPPGAPAGQGKVGKAQRARASSAEPEAAPEVGIVGTRKPRVKSPKPISVASMKEEAAPSGNTAGAVQALAGMSGRETAGAESTEQQGVWLEDMVGWPAERYPDRRKQADDSFVADAMISGGAMPITVRLSGAPEQWLKSKTGAGLAELIGERSTLEVPCSATTTLLKRLFCRMFHNLLWPQMVKLYSPLSSTPYAELPDLDVDGEINSLQALGLGPGSKVDVHIVAMPHAPGHAGPVAAGQTVAGQGGAMAKAKEEAKGLAQGAARQTAGGGQR